MKIVVFGLQRSGTNFIETMLRENYKGLQVVNTDSRYLWKHGSHFDLNKISKDAAHIVVIKSPYSWIESIIRKKVDIFKRRPELQANADTKHKIESLDLEALAKCWKDYISWFFSPEVMNKIKPEIFQYEFIIENKETLYFFLEKIRNRYGAEAVYQNKIERVKQPQKVSQSDAWTEERHDLYVNERITKLSWENVQTINSIIEDSVFDIAGYKKINTIEQYNRRKIDGKDQK